MSESGERDPWLDAGRDVDARIYHHAPAPDLKIKEITVMCLIFNRMIGTGIFTTPSILMQYTQNAFVTLLFWLCGCATALAGTYLFIEYGMYTPRYGEPGRKVAVPKSGGELVYLKYLLKKPPFFAACVFGITYILFANVAANSLSFAIRVMQAGGNDLVDPSTATNWKVRGIAIAACFCACALHCVWRTGGIYLNNAFGLVKVAMLVLITVVGFLSWGGVIPYPESAGPAPDLRPINGFGTVPSEPYAFARAYLSIIFAFGGFNQANYVLGEVDNPKRRFRWPAASAVVIVCMLYLGTNLAYMAVVPQAYQRRVDSDVALEFFRLTFGQMGGSQTDQDMAQRALRSMMAVSSLGNVIVTTYVAARVKQEIAKEGILPFRKFFARDITIRGIQLSKIVGAKTQVFYEYVPFGALVLHFGVSVFAILITAINNTLPSRSYSVLSLLYSYSIDAFFGACLSIGMLYLRFPWRERHWRAKSAMAAALSILCAFVYGISNLFPVAILWWPQTREFTDYHDPGYPWWLVPTVCMIVITIAGFWDVVYLTCVPRLRHRGRIVKILRLIDVERVEDYYVGVHDTVGKEYRNRPSGGERLDYEYEDVTVRFADD